MTPTAGGWSSAHDEDDPLKADAVIVDETSMVDVPLMAALLAALRGDCRLVLVGDPDQLPSVGPGNLFADLIRSGTCAHGAAHRDLPAGRPERHRHATPTW